MSLKLRELCELIQEYYLDNSSGGTLHIVLDDGNLEEHHIQWCLDNSIKDGKDERAKVIAEKLLKATPAKRLRLYEDHWEYTEPASIEFITDVI